MKVANYIKISLPAQSKNQSIARSTVAAFCAQLNPTIEQIEDLKTAVSEAVTNCIVHGYKSSQQGIIDVNCEIYEDEKVKISITDYGEGIADVKKAMQPFFTTVTTGERSGMGFMVMQAFCDAVDVCSANGKTTVTLLKKFTRDVE